MNRLLLTILFLAVLGIVGYWYSLQLKPPNLILISIDTLRADRLGAYGYNRSTSPFIDRLAEQSLVFDTAISPTSWTLPAHVSLFSGLYPSTHTVTIPKRNISADTQLLAEILNANGYQTYANVAGGYLSKRYGFDRGFVDYHVNNVKKVAKQFDMLHMNNYVEQLLPSLSNSQPYFLFLHTFDVHCPYIVPEPYLSMFNSANSEYIDPAHCSSGYYNKIKVSKGQAQYLSDRYDGSIRWVDDQLQKLFVLLEEQANLDNTIVVITSDHGDSFLEQGRIGHKKSLNRQLIHVPLIIKLPGQAAKRITHPVNLVDVMPTLLDFLNLPIPAAVQGQSLLDLINGAAADYLPDFQFSELELAAKLRSHFDNSGHLIEYTKTLNNSLYYRLQNDPLESNNLFGSSAVDIQQEIRNRMGELEQFTAGFNQQSKGTVEDASPEELEQLRTLGYIN